MGRVRKAIIPAAGLGTRFLPITKSVPKEMFPLFAKPVIQHIAEEAIQSGIEEIIIILGKNKQIIEQYFHANVELNHDSLQSLNLVTQKANFKFVIQEKPLGLGHAIWCGKELIRNEPFAVMLGDVVSSGEPSCLQQLIHFYHKHNAPIVAVNEVDWSDTHKYGIISGKKWGQSIYSIDDLIEKPKSNAPSNLAITGRYVLEPDIFERLQNTSPGAGGEIQLTDALQKTALEQSLYAYVCEHGMYDVGNPLGYLTAQIQMALEDDEWKREVLPLIQQEHSDED